MDSFFDLFGSPPVEPGEHPVQAPHAPIAPSADVTAKHCSSMGAVKIQESRSNLWEAMLGLYALGPWTDAEIAETCQVACSTISARRSELIKQGKVAEKSCGTRKNERTGVSNSLWRLA